MIVAGGPTSSSSRGAHQQTQVSVKTFFTTSLAHERMMLSSFPASPSSSFAHVRRSSFLRGNPTPFTEIKNSKVSIEFLKFSGAGTLTRLFVDSSSRASVKCFSQEEKQQLLQEDEVEVFEFERLFSNLNQSTLKREPGSLSSSIFLVAGTTIGAGILAIPAVTQESGFLASAVICILCWMFMVVTGLLIAEVNVNTMSELGTGGVSLVSMAMRTLGNTGVQVACWSYIFIHYALLVAYVARSSEILTNYLGIPMC